jgi:hypothetical protein
MPQFPTPRDASESDFVDSEVERISDELNCGERKFKVKRAIVKEITNRLEAAGWTVTPSIYSCLPTSLITLEVAPKPSVK